MQKMMLDPNTKYISIYYGSLILLELLRDDTMYQSSQLFIQHGREPHAVHGMLTRQEHLVVLFFVLKFCHHGIGHVRLF